MRVGGKCLAVAVLVLVLDLIRNGGSGVTGRDTAAAGACLLDVLLLLLMRILYGVLEHIKSLDASVAAL